MKAFALMVLTECPVRALQELYHIHLRRGQLGSYEATPDEQLDVWFLKGQICKIWPEF